MKNISAKNKAENSYHKVKERMERLVVPTEKMEEEQAVNRISKNNNQPLFNCWAGPHFLFFIQ